MAEHRFHYGPFAGRRIEHTDMPLHVLQDGRWPLKIRHFEGRYVRDEMSAGGRDWDWEE